MVRELYNNVMTIQQYRVLCYILLILVCTGSTFALWEVMQQQRLFMVVGYGFLIGFCGGLARFFWKRWNTLENLRFFALRQLLTPDQWKDTKNQVYVQNYDRFGWIVANRDFRQKLHASLNVNSIFKYHPHAEKPTLSMSIEFSKEWLGKHELIAGLGYAVAALPRELQCINGSRKHQHVVFEFSRTDYQPLSLADAKRFIVEWSKNIQALTIKPLTVLTVQTSEKSIFTPERPAVVQDTPQKIQDVFELPIALEKENIVILLGFDGNQYYTKYQGQTPREYKSWDDLWKIWGHFQEIKKALADFKHVPK